MRRRRKKGLDWRGRAGVVRAVDTNGLSSADAPGNRVLEGTAALGNDGDGMADDWEVANGLSPENPADGALDNDGDVLSNVQEYQLGLNPLVPNRPCLQASLSPTNAAFALTVQEVFGRTLTLEVSTNLPSWETLTNFTGTNSTIHLEDWAVTNAGQRVYRVVVP